jgi:hypothetical protein
MLAPPDTKASRQVLLVALVGTVGIVVYLLLVKRPAASQVQAPPAASQVQPAAALRLSDRPPSMHPPGSGWDHMQKREAERYTVHVFHNDQYNGMPVAAGGDGELVSVPVHTKNVVAVELIKGWFPQGMFVINPFNNLIDISTYDHPTDTTPASTHTILIPRSNSWSAMTLIAEIQKQAQNTGDVLLQHFKAGFQPHTAFVSFKSRAKFSLDFLTGPNRKNSLAYVLGFTVADHVSAGVGPTFGLSGTRSTDLAGPRFVNIRAKELHRHHTDAVLAQLTMKPGDGVVYYDESPDPRVFQHPVNLASLSLTFTYFDGKLESLRNHAASIVEQTEVAARAHPDDESAQAALKEAYATWGELYNIDPWRPYRFNKLEYAMTLAVSGMRWKRPFDDMFERMA